MSQNLTIACDQRTENPAAVYSYGSAMLSQCDRTEVFLIEWHGDTLQFKLNELIAFRRKLSTIDLSTLFDTERPDIEVIYLPHLDRHLILTLGDILMLRELLTGSFAMLQLNSMVHRALYNPFEGQLVH